MEKVLSVIIPVYNMEKYLSQCLGSVVVPEKVNEYEVIVVNDGSSDSSLEIMQGFAKRFPSLFKICDKENGGYGSCFNSGIRLASGKYTFILDSDDYLDNAAFSSFLDALKYCDADALLYDCITVDAVTNLQCGNYCNHSETYGPIDFASPLVFNHFIHTFAFRSKLLSNCSCPENVLYTDNIIMLAFLNRADTFFYLPYSLYMYRVNRTGQSVSPDVVVKKTGDLLTVLDVCCSMHMRKETSCRRAMIHCICQQAHSLICGISLLEREKARQDYKRLAEDLICWQQTNNVGIKEMDGFWARLVVVVNMCVGFVLVRLAKGIFNKKKGLLSKAW